MTDGENGIPPVRIGMGKEKLTIVSTYDEFCGISGYTRSLEKQLQNDFDLTVLELDQYLLRSPHPKVQKLADAHIREMARALKSAGSVNIQLEHGTLGRTPKQIIRRFTWLAEAAPRLSVTFHTILTPDQFDWAEWWKKARVFNLAAAGRLRRSHKRGSILNRGIYEVLARESRRKPVTAITHTRRDMRLLRDVFGLKSVLDHPLSYVTPLERTTVRAGATRASFPITETLPPGVTLLGTFGFLSAYKGFDTVVKALRHLPDDVHLLIFGGIHPQTIKKQAPIDLYIKSLLDEAYVDRSVLDEVMGGKKAATAVSVTIDGTAGNLFQSHPKSLVGRVHFMGALKDEDFLAAMSICDAVVLPYLEVGQSASGPIAQALEMNCRVLASRTNAFMQYARYHPNQIEFFDIGNHLQLAEMIAAKPQYDPARRNLAYDWSTNVATYRKANAQTAVKAAP